MKNGIHLLSMEGNNITEKLGRRLEFWFGESFKVHTLKLSHNFLLGFGVHELVYYFNTFKIWPKELYLENVNLTNESLRKLWDFFFVYNDNKFLEVLNVKNNRIDDYNRYILDDFTTYKTKVIY